MERVAEAGTSINFALYVGHGTVRRRVMGLANREPTEGEMNEMKELVARGMEEGALGLSTGLAYGLWNVGVRALGPSRTAVSNYAVPVIALVVGAVFLGEAVAPVQIGAGAVVFAGLFLVRRRN